jgi:hypothetical protein
VVDAADVALERVDLHMDDMLGAHCPQRRAHALALHSTARSRTGINKAGRTAIAAAVGASADK